MVTTWKTPGAWLIVRDSLTMGPRQGEDSVTPHTRPPADDDADHMLIRTVECLEGSVEVELVCEPVFDYGRVPADWTLHGDDRHAADATGAGQTVRLSTDMLLGIEGNRVRARHTMSAGEQLYCCLSWAEGLVCAENLETRTLAWRLPSASGAPGSAGRGFRITAGVTQYSAPPWLSKA